MSLTGSTPHDRFTWLSQPPDLAATLRPPRHHAAVWDARHGQYAEQEAAVADADQLRRKRRREPTPAAVTCARRQKPVTLVTLTLHNTGLTCLTSKNQDAVSKECKSTMSQNQWKIIIT
jgi:hypothetical protein